MVSASLVVAAAQGAFGQTEAPRTAFEVASIRMYAVGSRPSSGDTGIQSYPGGINVRYTRLVHCLSWAYDIAGPITGPDWIYERYDITAKAPGPVPEAQLKLMLQKLLEDRFQLKMRRETKEFPVAVLILAKDGPKNLHAVGSEEAPKNASASQYTSPHRLSTGEYQIADGKLVLKSVSMASFAVALGGRPPYGISEQVTDKTGLNGVFEITLSVKEFNVDDPAFAGDYEELKRAMFNFLSKTLEKQYGLKLEHRKVPLETLVVESGNKAPTAN